MKWDFSKWDFSKINILDLLPQRPPFVMIGSLVHCDECITVTSFSIDEDNIFCDNGVLDVCALAENIAQTCAARLGFINKYILHRAVQIGYIGSIRDMIIYRSPRQGETLTTTIVVREQIMGLTLIDASVKAGDDTIATTEMKIALSNIEINEDESGQKK